MKILMIDDEEDIRKVGRLSLERVGKFAVVQACSGPDGLNLAEKELPDLILLDVMMPGVDGPETLARLKQSDSLKNTPVIFMTARVQPQDLERYHQMGAIGVVQKPFDPMTLPDEIRAIFARHSATPS